MLTGVGAGVGTTQSMQTALFYAERRKDGLEGEGLEIVRQRRRTHELLAGACPILANKAFPPASASSLDSHSRGGVSQSFPGGQRWDARFGAVCKRYGSGWHVQIQPPLACATATRAKRTHGR